MVSFLNKNALKIILLWLVILTLLYSTLSILRHDHFQSGGFDLGIYDQAIWQYAHFLKPTNTVINRHILGDHLTLTLPLLAPLFWIWDDVRMLLIFQAFWLSFSTLAIYKLCRLRNLSGFTSLNLSFTYSLFYGIQQAVFFDFHPVIIGVGLIPWLAYFLEDSNRKLFFISLILLLLTQENMGLALLCLGLIYIAKKKYCRPALIFIIVGLIWSFISVKIINRFSPTGFQYWPKISLNPLFIIREFFNSPEKQLTWLYSLSWFSFLPLLSPTAFLAVLADLAQYFISGPNFSRTWSPFMHHRAILGPFLLFGTLEALMYFKKRRISLNKITLVMVAIMLVLQYIFHFPLNKLTKPIYWQKETWMKNNSDLFKKIPSSASLATQQNLLPHLSHRKNIYLVYPRLMDFPNQFCGQKSCWWLDFVEQPEYLVVDLRPDQWLTQTLAESQDFIAAVQNMEKVGKITKQLEVNFAKLYRINNQIFRL